MFKERTGLIIDKPKPGFGLSNDGNTARRFFENIQITSEITGLDSEVIERFSNIMAAISCNRIVPYTKFETYSMKTAELFLKTYPTFTFSPTVHKILYHGADYIQSFTPIPLGKIRNVQVCVMKLKVNVFRSIKRRAARG